MDFIKKYWYVIAIVVIIVYLYREKFAALLPSKAPKDLEKSDPLVKADLAIIDKFYRWLRYSDMQSAIDWRATLRDQLNDPVTKSYGWSFDQYVWNTACWDRKNELSHPTDNYTHPPKSV